MIYFGFFIGGALCFAALVSLFAFYMDWQERLDEVIYMNRPDLDFDLKELDKQSPKVLGTDIRRPKFGD